MGAKTGGRVILRAEGKAGESRTAQTSADSLKSERTAETKPRSEKLHNLQLLNNTREDDILGRGLGRVEILLLCWGLCGLCA